VLQCLLKAVEQMPGDSSIWNNLACVYQELGEIEKSFESVNTAIELDPENSFALHTLGDAFEMKGNYETAFDSYKKAVELDPYNKQHTEALEFILEKLDIEFDIDSFLDKAKAKYEN